ncbi:TetR/AcrR family transcriptional regulator [Paenibacillus radicis (ex Xue et al. 2023)]|uniref:TetR/AcrR family transcriptional regulator n=1 Tax=Paenibacillus radicis (ex Xue et al. 2023) TaxID=2972489 RepID=A0ABT1YR13_9BACL|nr:TetR/AcrR family transcriptional regulator [Paenibacillus radicis (ex Xue et al. 2023)]MCR8634799.1 TetR/AcrR family transcriptional regulator [Paenibacillus radicis (ex Xue et al. 2023)]
MKRELKREQTTKLLLDTTRTLISEKGCSKTTLSDIMERSGLSKGAIFHYVQGKDELLALVLESRLAEINDRFFDAVAQGVPQFKGPMQKITESLSILDDPSDVTNQILMYLLSKSDQPAVSEVIQRFYEQAVNASKQWIKAGQQHDVIPASINADKTAELFVLLSYGFRMRAATAPQTISFGISDFSEFIVNILQPNSNSKKESGD